MTPKKIFATVALSFVALGLSGGPAQADSGTLPHAPDVGKVVEPVKPLRNLLQSIRQDLQKPPGNYWELIGLCRRNPEHPQCRR